MSWRAARTFFKEHKVLAVTHLLAAAGIACSHYYYSNGAMAAVLISVNLILLFNNRVALGFIAFVLGYSIIDSLTKRLGGYYFHEIPLEILNIVFDSNYDEATNLAATSTAREKVAAAFAVLLLAAAFAPKVGKKPVGTKRWALATALALGFFFLPRNPLAQAVVKVVEDGDMILKRFDDAQLRRKFKWNATSLNDEKQTIVLYLGESHRGDHLSINGYERDTTPLLRGEDLISFTNAVSQAPNTIGSTPLILTRKTVHDGQSFAEKSLITAFKEAGFKTWYVSYLTKANLGDDAVNIIGNEADHYITSSPSVALVDQLLKDEAKKKLIVYKTVGSHFPYHVRYPPEFDLYQPAFTRENYRNPTIEDRELLVNSYDNSIRFSVDDHIKLYLDRLKKEDGLVFLAFISDHGTAMFEDGRSLYGGASKANFNIALFFWFNELYKSRNGAAVQALAANKTKKISAFCFLDTMFDLGFISTEKRKGCSLLDKNPDAHKRLVVIKSIHDYDKDIR